MAGRGPAPKLGEKLGHVTADRRVNRPGDGKPKTSWPMPAGEWSPQAVAWWEAATSSVAAEVAWLPEDRPRLERVLWLVETWWRTTQTNPEAAVRMADTLRRDEAALYLGPAERARAGLVRPSGEAAGSRSSSSRARLRAVDDAVG